MIFDYVYIAALILLILKYYRFFIGLLIVVIVAGTFWILCYYFVLKQYKILKEFVDEIILNIDST